MKKNAFLCLLVCLMSGTSVCAAQTDADAAEQPSQTVQQQAPAAETKAAPASNTKKVKPLPTCLDFTEVYSRAVLGNAEATPEDMEEMISLSAIMMGYVSAMQDIYGGYLVGMSPNDNEWTLLEYVNKLCLEYPHWTFQRAVRSVPPIRKTMDSLRDGEFTRCMAYVEQAKQTICAPVCQAQQPLQ